MESGIVTSVLGNVLTIGIGLLVWVVKNKCKHCESECDMPCCKVSARDETIRDTSHPPDLSLSDPPPEVCIPISESNPPKFPVVQTLD